jgi:hypothetical protein
MDNISLAQVSLREGLGKHFVLPWPDCGSVQRLYCALQRRGLHKTLGLYCSGSHRALGCFGNHGSTASRWLRSSLMVQVLGQANGQSIEAFYSDDTHEYVAPNVLGVP